MEVGASLVAFIGFGLTSIKIVHKFITSIRDGPQRLQDLARALDNLRAAYERTQALQDLPGILESSPSLLEQLRQCNDDVDRFSKNLVKMQVQTGDRLYNTLRKKFKLPLCEDEIRDMLGIVVGHVNSFTLEISILDIRISQRNSSEISQVITRNEHHHTSLQEIKEDVLRSNSKIEHVQNVVDALALKVESLPAVSTQQSTLMLDMFAKLEGKFNDLLLRERTIFDNTPRILSAFKIAPAHEYNAESGNARVMGSIQRLSALLDEKNQVAESDEAQDIISDLETLLQQMDTAIQHVKLDELISHETGFHSVEKEHRKETKWALGVLRCSPNLALNPQGWSRHGPLSGRVMRRKDNIALYSSQLGDWLVSTRRQWRTCEAQADDEEHQEFNATIAFKPTARGGSHHIKVSIQQLQQANGFHTFTPVVSIGRIRPSNSRVFQCIKLGLFDEFRRLIATGEASLQDRDEQGAPLLHHACSQPEICKFLIKHGADVDELANVSHVNGSSERCSIPLMLAYHYSLSTFKCLLAAGADPTLPYLPNYLELHSTLAFSAGNVAHFESLLSLGGTFFNVNDQDAYGQTLMHRSMENSKGEHIIALVKVGADVNAKNRFGQNCLQYLVEEMRMVGRCCDNDLNALSTLMQTGADIFSRDEKGRSIWETAIENRQQGSYARDALNSILVSYGYHAEVVEFAEKVPRHGTYIKWYTRYNFDLMWEGKEHLCPYYDDEALGLNLASFEGMIGHTSSDSSSNVEELDEEDYDETESEDNNESGSEASEEFRSRQTELSEAAEPVGDSLTRTTNGVDSEPDSMTSFESLGSLSRDPRGASGLNGPHEPLNASVANWMFSSRAQREAVLDDASTRGHEGLGPPPYGFDAGHADEIFHNPWTEG